MLELNHKFYQGRMNKDLDERLVPNGEYRDALNIEINTSEGSNMGTVQTLMGTEAISNFMSMNLDLYCVGSIADEKNDKIYWMASGQGKDIIAEYNYVEETIHPVVVDIFPIGTPANTDSGRTLNFDKSFLITGINIIDDMLFWTDNNSEPKRIHIERCKMGTTNFSTPTKLFVRHYVTGSSTFTGDDFIDSGKLLKQEHITVIKKPPLTPPLLEIKSTTREDIDGNNSIEISTTISASGNIFSDTNVVIGVAGLAPLNNPANHPVFDTPADFQIGDTLLITTTGNNQVFEIRAKIVSQSFNGNFYTLEIIKKDPNITNDLDVFEVKLELPDPLFKFKFPRFAYRYKYEDGEYSTYSPFTEVAFLPGEFDYLNKEGYNLGMVNNVRYLAIKDFVHERLIPDDVVAIDILYKESNSPNVYSIKTIKKAVNTGFYSVHDEWNAISKNQVVPAGSNQRTKGFLEITSELIHGILPSNQLLRNYDNVPRKALAQEITGNRIVYGNYLQNYDLSNREGTISSALEDYGPLYGSLTAQENINVNVDVKIKEGVVGDTIPTQLNPFYAGTDSVSPYGPAKSIKTLRTYQVGVVYIDEFGRETPVFSDSIINDNSITVKKIFADKATKLSAQIKSIKPEWAKYFKFFIKETSNEYYNLAMDRWYNAEDGNIWLSFPSSERNKVDLETFLILKKEHDTDVFTPEDVRYKIIAIENEAPLFIKTRQYVSGTFQDDGTKLGSSISNFPLPGNTQVRFDKIAFEQLGWANPSSSTTTGTPGAMEPGTQGTLYLQNYGEFFMRAKVNNDFSAMYEIKNITFSAGGNGSYIVEFAKQFEDDMSITSASLGPDAFIDRYSNVEMHLYRNEVRNRPEFDGRFFAKIKKDVNLINSIIKEDSTIGSSYYVTSAVQAQYISPSDCSKYKKAGMADIDVNDWYGISGGVIGPSFENQLYKISTNDSGIAESRWSTGDPGQGKEYWKKASFGDNDPSGIFNASTNTNGLQSQSSGWFIDKIEGFRRSKAAWKNYGKIMANHPDFSWSGYGTHHEKDSLNEVNHGFLGSYSYGGTTYNETFKAGLVATSTFSGNLGEFYDSSDTSDFGPLNQMQLEGTSTIGSDGNTWHNYLGITDAKGPWNQLVYDFTVSNGNTGSEGVSMIHCNSDMNTPKNFEKDSGIVPSVGIHENVVHLSYSGIGSIESSSSNYNDSANNYFEYSNNTAQTHVADIEFINSITTPGTIWRWKEDPGQCVYQTLQYNASYNAPLLGETYHSNVVPYPAVSGVFDYQNSPPASLQSPNLGNFDYTKPINFTDQLWHYNSFDQSEGQNVLGVALYNYCSLREYPIDNPLQDFPIYSHTGSGAHRAGGTYMNWWWWFDDDSAGQVMRNRMRVNAIKNCSVVAVRDVADTLSDGQDPHTVDMLACKQWGMGYRSTYNISSGASTSSIYSESCFTHNHNSIGIAPALGNYGKWPMMTRDWGKPYNKRRRFQFFAKSLERNTVTGERYNLGEAPADVSATNPGHQHLYLPTNDPDLHPHFASDFSVLTLAGVANTADNASNNYPNLPGTPAPGIRPDGVHSGYKYPGPNWTITTGDTTNKSHSYVPYYKVIEGTGGSNPSSPPPGSCTWQVLSKFNSYEDEKYSSTNPAIWETEPKEDIGLDIYHEIGQVYPIELNENTVEQFVGPIKDNIIENSRVSCWVPPTGPWKTLVSNAGGEDIRVNIATQGPSLQTPPTLPGDMTFISLADSDGNPVTFLPGVSVTPAVNDILYFTRADGSVTSTKVIELAPLNFAYALAPDVHNYEAVLPFHNCYSFGNGVESDRIRDDFNQVTIDNGPKASTVLEETYAEERRGSGLIYSGIYNSMSGINNLNQFIAAEKITKDLNPKYGTIQKLHSRNTNLLTLCEDKVFKILANKDALFNADGNANLISTENVLGQATPLLGEYGISKNPESFASESYRTYFTDKTRGAVIRLSQDGLTAISDYGMKDYFSDILPNSNRIIGSYDDKKKEYNLSVDYYNYNVYNAKILGSSKTGNPPYTPEPRLILDCKDADNIQVNYTITGPGISPNTIVVSKTTLGGGECQVDLDKPPIANLSQNLGNYSPYSAGGVVYWSTKISSSKIVPDLPNTTITFSEISKGWVSFKSWFQENGLSLNNNYYSFKHGDLHKHHSDQVDINNFYGDQYDSSIQVLFNEDPGTVKTFHSLNYEGSQSRILENYDTDDYWDDVHKDGWYVSNLHTNLQEGDTQTFKNKEGKWFSEIKGQSTEWLDDTTAGNIDTKEFSYQGIDETHGITTLQGGFTSWDCLPAQNPCSTGCYYSSRQWGVPRSFLGTFQSTQQVQDFFWDPVNQAKHPGDYYTIILDPPGNTNYNAPGPGYNYVNGVDNAQGHYACSSSYVLFPITNPDVFPNAPAYNTWNNPQIGQYPSSYVVECPNISSSTGPFISSSNQVNQCGQRRFESVFEIIEDFATYVDSTAFYHGMSRADFLAAIYPNNPPAGMGFVGPGFPENWLQHFADAKPIATSTPSFTCVEIQGLGGAYADEAACYADVNSPCTPVPETYNCITGQCIDPNDGSGAFTGVNALLDCLSVCQPCTPATLSTTTTDATNVPGTSNCYDDGEISITAITLGATWTYEIFDVASVLAFNSTTPVSTGGTDSSGNILFPGNYTLIVTDDLGCTTSVGFTINCSLPPVPACPTTGPYTSYLGPNTTPHEFTAYDVQPSNYPACDNGELRCSALTLGSSNWTAFNPAYTVEWFELDNSGNLTSIYNDPFAYGQGQATTPVTGLTPGDYIFEITELSGDACKYQYGPFNLAQCPVITGPCTNPITYPYNSSTTFNIGPCSQTPVTNFDAWLGHLGPTDIIDNMCLNRCEPYEPDGYVINQGAVRHYLGCIPTDAAYVKVAYYGTGGGFSIDSDSLLFDDPTQYTGNQYIIWDTVEPTREQMDLGPGALGPGPQSPSGSKYQFTMIITAYDANGVYLDDENNNVCGSSRLWYHPCECNTNTGLNGWECSVSGCVPVQQGSFPAINFPNLYSCNNGYVYGGVYYSGCISSQVSGCMDPNATNYDPTATLHVASNCQYAPIACEGSFGGSIIDDYEFNILGVGPLPWIEDTTTYTEAVYTNNQWRSAMQNVITNQPPTSPVISAGGPIGFYPSWKSYSMTGGAPTGNSYVTEIIQNQSNNPAQLVMGITGTPDPAYNWASGIYTMMQVLTKNTYQVTVNISQIYDASGVGFCGGAGANACSSPTTKGRLQVMQSSFAWTHPNTPNNNDVYGLQHHPGFGTALPVASFDFDDSLFNPSTGVATPTASFTIEFTVADTNQYPTPNDPIRELLIIQLDGYYEQKIFIDSVCVIKIAGPTP